MKRFLLILPILFACCSSLAAAQSFKIATLAPDGTRWMDEMRKGADDIEKRTGGRVTFRFYPGGVMGNDKNVLRKIRVGQLHGGALTGGGVAEVYPDSQIYSLPLAFRSFEEVDYVRAKMDDALIAELKQRGFVSFGIGEGGFAYLMSNRPVEKSEDLASQKVWIPEGDEISRAGLKAVDVSPIPLPLVDVMTGLQTGLIDTVGASPTGAIALQWHSRVRYVMDTPLMYVYGLLIIDRKAFERMTAADQAVVEDVMKAVFRKLNQLNREDNEKARTALQNNGIQFIKPSEANRQRWQDNVTGAMERLSRQGMFSEATLQTFRDHLNDFRTRHQATE